MRTTPITEVAKYQGPRPRRSIHSDRMEPAKSIRSKTRNPDQRLHPNQLDDEQFEDSEESTPVDVMSGDETAYGWKPPKYTPESYQLPAHVGWKNADDYEVRSLRRNLKPEVEVQTPPKSPQDKKQKNIPRANSNGNDNVQGEDWFKYVLLVLVVGAIGFMFKDYLTDAIGIEPTKPLTKEELTKEIKNIRNEFPSQSDSIWPQFSSGIKKVEQNPSHPSVFLLLHDSEEDTPTCLAHKIAKLAMRFLNATNQDLLILEGEELGKDQRLRSDYGELIADKQHQVEEHRSMIVKNLHKIPGEVARSFHSFCDIETPLVDKAVYLFTMKASGASRYVDKPTMLAERELKNIWGEELNIDILMPLIVRITDNVLVVQPEYNITLSCQM